MRAFRLLCSLSLLAALTACGIKGPLYLPDGRTTAAKTAETPADHNKPRQEAPQ